MTGCFVAKVFFARGWHCYHFDLSKPAIRAGTIPVQSFYDYAETPKPRGKSSEERTLSVAFDNLQVLPKR